MFITPAYAQAAGSAGGGFGIESLWIFVAIFAIMYFLIIRPQRKQLKKRQELLNSVRRGDSVVTGGGVLGKVIKVFDDSGEVEVEISDNVRVRILRSTISEVRTKGEPIADKKDQTVVKAKGQKNNNAQVEKRAQPKAVEKVVQAESANLDEKKIDKDADETSPNPAKTGNDTTKS